MCVHRKDNSSCRVFPLHIWRGKEMGIWGAVATAWIDNKQSSSGGAVGVCVVVRSMDTN